MKLADYTTVRLGGPARAFVRAETEQELIDAVRAADAAGEPVLILGGGSNLVVSDEGFDGTVIQVATRGVSRDGGPGALTVAAGEDWDAVVARSVAEGLAGLECLSGIPGLAGATPIQNVGAYGQEVSETITRVRVYDRGTGDVQDLPNERCGFGYRTSRFRGADRFVVLSVTFDLAVMSTATRLSSSFSATSPLTSITAPWSSSGTTTIAENRALNSSTAPGSPPASSATYRPACAMVNIPCAITSGSPTDLASRSFQWITLKSPEAPAYRTRSSRVAGYCFGPSSVPGSASA